MSPTAVGLLLVLLVPLTVTAQPLAYAPLEVPDATGDVVDFVTREPHDEAPAYTDLTGFTVTVEGDHLTIRFDVADAVLEAPDPARLIVSYILHVDSDGDGIPDHAIDISSITGLSLRSDAAWRGSLMDYDSPEGIPLGDAKVGGESLTTMVPLSTLGPLQNLRFQALMVGTEPGGLFSPEDSVTWTDTVPDDWNEWRSLDTRTATEQNTPQPPPSPSEPDGHDDISALFVEDLPEQDFATARKAIKAIHGDFRAYLAGLGDDLPELTRSFPEGVAELFDLDLPIHHGEGTESAFSLCKEELKAARSKRLGMRFFTAGATREVIFEGSRCVRAFTDLYRAYVVTRDDEVYDLMRRFVLATAPTFEPEARRDYLMALRAVPGLVEQGPPESDGSMTERSRP